MLLLFSLFRKDLQQLFAISLVPPLLPWSPSFLANSRNVISLGINLHEGGLGEYVYVYCSILYLLLWTQFGKVTVYQKMFALEISHWRSPFLEGNITRI